MSYYDFLETKLQTELVHHVLSYSYSFQPNVLLEDIRNFHSSFTVICSYNRSFYLSRLGAQNEGFEKNMLLYELCAYFFLTYTQGVVYRFCVQIKKSIGTEKQDDERHIRQLWGMMNVDQRRNFTNYHTS